MELDKAIKSRKSVKHFLDKKPNWKDIIECIDSARYAPMAGNIFPIKFVVVDDKEKIQKIAQASQQPFIAKAQYIVVVCSDSKLLLNAYEERAEKFCRQQAGAAIQNMLLKIEEKGLETCWVGYYLDYLIKETLNIPKDIEIEAIFPIGYESKKQGTSKIKKRKTDLIKKIYFNKWKNKVINPEKKINV